MISPFTLENKRILITGASSGLGRAIAIGCSRMGANVIGIGRDKGRLLETLRFMNQGSHQLIEADLTSAKDRERIGADLSTPLEGIVHCAGISRLSPIRLITEAHLNELNQINVYAPVLLTQVLLRQQKIQSGGSVLFVASIAAHIGVAGVAAYSGTKSSLIAMARCLAMEVVKRKIRVNTLSPALVETPLLAATAKLTGSMDAERKNYPLGFGKPEDVANAAIFFLSDASRWITGSDLIMDGGLTIG
jgi:NAD(P)-dependent dehydrogenase (short-subunit alcohol dehydrogenase family)